LRCRIPSPRCRARSRRKFFCAPDIVHTTQFTAVMPGSGNRERPLATFTDGRFYALFD
jgi:hypothetical protein